MAAFGGPRTPAPAAPEKGVFPLDHFGECKSIMQRYMQCLKENGNHGEKCRHISKEYLQCRMDRNLMARQELSELGFSDDEEKPLPATESATPAVKKSESGFLAGLPQRNSGKSES